MSLFFAGSCLVFDRGVTANNGEIEKCLGKIILSENPMKMPEEAMYALALAQAKELEALLNHAGKWDAQPLPETSFEDMGPFGNKTMTFYQWLQFVLIPIICDIAAEGGEFPSESMLAPYAAQVLQGTPYVDQIHDVLFRIDDLINRSDDEVEKPLSYPPPEAGYAKPSELPDVVFTLGGMLQDFEGDQLEYQLQTFDIYLDSFAADVRPVLSKLLMDASVRAKLPATRNRLLSASQAVASGGGAAAAYDHELSMKKYQKDFKKGYGDESSKPA